MFQLACIGRSQLRCALLIRSLPSPGFLHVPSPLPFQYLDGTNFYKACNLGGDARIDNADQRVTADIKDFSDEIASLYASLLKPLLDVVLFTWKLGSLLGWQGPVAMHSYFVLSGIGQSASSRGGGPLRREGGCTSEKAREEWAMALCAMLALILILSTVVFVFFPRTCSEKEDHASFGSVGGARIRTGGILSHRAQQTHHQQRGNRILRVRTNI